MLHLYIQKFRFVETAGHCPKQNENRGARKDRRGRLKGGKPMSLSFPAISTVSAVKLDSVNRRNGGSKR